MAELRSILEELGHGGVETYLKQRQRRLHQRLRATRTPSPRSWRRHPEALRLPRRVLVRSGRYLRAVRRRLPLPGRGAGRQAAARHLLRRSGRDLDRFAAIDPAAYLPEEFRLGDRALYLYAPDGLGSSSWPRRCPGPACTRASSPPPGTGTPS